MRSRAILLRVAFGEVNAFFHKHREMFIFACLSFPEGFGIDSIIELIAGGILLWWLLVEQRGGSVEVIEQAEVKTIAVTTKLYTKKIE